MHKVKTKYTLSSNKLLTSLVLQGTVLSPLLCIIYVTGLSKLAIMEIIINYYYGNLFCYADDTALITTGDSWESVYKYAENSLQESHHGFITSIYF